MKVLFVNPNTSVSVTERIAGVARAAASVGTEVLAVTAPCWRALYRDPRRGGDRRARGYELELLAEHAPGCDVAVIAAFADPGLGGARELLPMPSSWRRPRC